MWSLILEAIGAMSLLVFIVWWTMFSGRKQHTDKKTAILPHKQDAQDPDLQQASKDDQ